LIEENGLLGDRRVGFGRMIGIVQSDGNEIARLGNASSEPGLTSDERQFLHIRSRDLGKPFWREVFSREIRDNMCEVANPSRGIDQSRSLLARLAIADQLHCSSPLEILASSGMGPS